MLHMFAGVLTKLLQVKRRHYNALLAVKYFCAMYYQRKVFLFNVRSIENIEFCLNTGVLIQP